jgi:hypothetical protein
MRLPGAALQTKEKRLTYLLTHYQDQLHEFVVVTERGVRVRKTASS